MTTLSTSGTLPDIHTLRMCFYGAGSMAEAIVRGILDRGLTEPERIGMMNRQNAERMNELSSRYGINGAITAEDKDAMLRESDIVFLAMKPKDAAEAIKRVRDLLHPGQLIVSLIAGMTISTLETLLGKPMPIARTMPNTSSTIGLGATGISFSTSVSDSQRLLADALFQAVGLTAIVEEPMLEVVTGLSGSGPAYIYYMMEAMIAAGSKLGLTEEAARELTIQTVLGAAHMVKATGEDPAELRRKVTSPNGSTQAAIEKFDEYRFTEAVLAAVTRSAERAMEMGADIERNAKS
ncbi:pyrroline-5-carboxylate reductase [Paenibacillus sacheonensis]|uniref:Pyrroline-5-carboxylate reductase n=1 Tax=Paenibacillus sacheonensis TaxID=742054 RepID=A0A7X4YRK1_9BACL|nr:pyrroline-5-carboxylate reductase [Paenibacillus sacheonensis]MBM7563489.1 pyrroline-5-carboxylate reductase [Paenibacillus sacheonensis]NBC71213.1 pyrroline-5-carboxylate reductase [Paenibacillus sacheonensis]